MAPKSLSRDVPLCLPLCILRPHSIPHNIASSKICDIASSKMRDMEVAALSDGGQERAEYKRTHANLHGVSDIVNIS
jgi:hypothetical protein